MNSAIQLLVDRPLATIVSSLVALLLLGCANAPNHSDAERSRSFQSFAKTKIDDLPSTEYLQRRTAAIVNGGVAVSEAIADGPLIGLRFVTEAGKSVNGAIPRSRDRLARILPDRRPLPERSQDVSDLVRRAHRDIAVPRVVVKRVEDDLAIIHVDANLTDVFEWADTATEKPGDAVFAVGSASRAFISESICYCAPTCLAGRITSIEKLASGAIKISHNVPLRFGDSGGPLTTVKGQLLGVNSRVEVSMIGTDHDVTIHPDRTWVQRAIDEDQRVDRQPAALAIGELKNKRAAHMVVRLW